MPLIFGCARPQINNSLECCRIESALQKLPQQCRMSLGLDGSLWYRIICMHGGTLVSDAQHQTGGVCSILVINVKPSTRVVWAISTPRGLWVGRLSDLTGVCSFYDLGTLTLSCYVHYGCIHYDWVGKCHFNWLVMCFVRPTGMAPCDTRGL